MAREHPAVPKQSSSQKQQQKFDGESDDEEEINANKVALAKKQSSVKDKSRLFVKEVNGREKPINFYLLEDDFDWNLSAELREQITECGGKIVKERPEEGYTLVDPRTEEGELEMSSHTTPARRVVSFRFVEESIKQGSLISPLELGLFVKEDKPVKFHLHESLPNDEIDSLKDEILLRGGNPEAELSEARVVVHSTAFRDKKALNRVWRQIELFETSNWLRSCITMKRFSITGAGGRFTVPPAPRIIPTTQPGRKPGAPRTEYTEQDDQCLIAWMAFQFGKNQAGRQGNLPYKLLVQDPEQLWWAHRHTWHSWRERYKKKRVQFDPLIIQAVDERENNKPQKHRELRLPKFPDSEEENSEDEEEVAQEAGPSKTRARPKPTKRKAPDSSDFEDEQPEPEPAKQIAKGLKRVKVGSQPKAAPVIKTSASQKAREAPRLSTPSPLPREPSSAPPAPKPVSPPAREKPVREETPATQSEEDQDQEDSQSSTQLENGIIDEAMRGAPGVIERHNAELATVAANETGSEDDEEGYTFDDPDVDVVGITQIDALPEDKTESTSGSDQEDEFGETGQTVLDTIEERLSALADRFGAVYSRVEAYYKREVENGKGDAAALDFTEQQLRADLRQEKGKGRAS